MHISIPKIAVIIPSLLLLAVLSACGDSSTSPTTNNAAPAERNVTLDPDMPTFDDVFAYCLSKGTLDEPGPDYTGPETPETVSNTLQQLLSQADQLPEDWNNQPVYWRCMNNDVYACIPRNGMQCRSKLDFSRAGSMAMEQYCQENTNKATIPAVITGQDTPYEWLCDGSNPMVKSQRFEADQAGYNSAMWLQVTPPAN